MFTKMIKLEESILNKIESKTDSKIEETITDVETYLYLTSPVTSSGVLLGP